MPPDGNDNVFAEVNSRIKNRWPLCISAHLHGVSLSCQGFHVQNKAKIEIQVQEEICELPLYTSY
jgi:hypothetical protein